MQLSHSLPVLLAAALLGFGCSAQQPPEPAASGAPAPANTNTVLQTQATTVLVDVVVTDKGKAIRGLDRRRFHVFEGEREQPITFLEEHAPAAPGTDALRPATPREPSIVTNIPDEPPSSAANVLLLDGLNTPLADQVRVRQQMVAFMEHIEPGTQMAIFTLGSQLRMVQGFTANVGELAEAIRSRQATPQIAGLVDPRTDATMNSAVNDLAGMGASSESMAALQQFEAETTSMQTDVRVTMTLSAMQQLARYLNAVPGRKNLIWFSGSFPLTVDPDPSLENPTEASRTYYEQLRETSLMLAAARVAVYPVDARELITLPSADASQSQLARASAGGAPGSGRRGSRSRTAGASGVSAPANDDAKVLKQAAAEHASMEEIAEATGGKAYVNSNGLKDAVADAVANGACYYTLGYVPARRDFHGEFRRIKVRIDDAPYQLAYRSGYYADPPGKPASRNPGQASRIVATTMHGAPPSTEILFKARVLPSTDPSLRNNVFSAGPVGEMAAALKPPLTRYVIDYAIDPRGISFDVAAEGVHKAEMELVVLGYDANGKRVNYLDHGFTLTLNRDRFALAESRGIPLRMEISLPAGRNYMRIAVQDLATGRCGSVETLLTPR